MENSRYRTFLVEPAEWRQMAENAYQAALALNRKPSYDRIDYCAFCVDQKMDKPAGFATVHLVDGSNAYLQHGGCFPGVRGNYTVKPVYQSILDFLLTRHARLFQLVANTNTEYLRLSIMTGWRISGVRYADGILFVEMNLERK